MTPARPDLGPFVSPDELRSLLGRALQEDLGPQRRDVTTACALPEPRAGHGRVVARQGGHLAGGVLLRPIAEAWDGGVRADVRVADGSRFEPGATLAELHGPLDSLLAIERTALNLLCHLSGVATLTARFVAAAAGRARICDTRKTLPGLRGLQKYAVVCGGGTSHRRGLHDAVLVKDNHLAHHALADLHEAVGAIVARARAAVPAPAFVEIEVDDLDQLAEVLHSGTDIILLDNMSPARLAEAVAVRNREAPGVQLEASGGVTLANVAAVARTGVDRIAVGALTHSAPAVDIALDLT